MPLSFSGEAEADELLRRDPFALLVGMVLDQQIPLEWAFSAPLLLKKRLGRAFSAKAVAAMPLDELVGAFVEKPALHRFPAAMAERVHQLARLVVERFGGKPENVWTSAADGKELLANIRSLPGFGAQKAQIFVALLGKQLGVRPPGWEQAAGVFGEPGSLRSVADIDSPESRAAVREHKRQLKAAAKSVATPAGR